MHLLFGRFVAVLSIFTLLLVSCADRAQSSKADDLNRKESYAYVLTMDEVTKSANIRKALGQFLDNDAKTSKRIQADGPLARGTFSAQAKIFDLKYPDLAAIIRQGGMSTYEYFLCNHVLLHAFMFVAEKQNGKTHQYSGEDINPANIPFVEQHIEEIRKSMQDIRLKA